MDSLFGITFSKLMKLLFENKFNVSFSQIPKIIILVLISIRNSFFSFRSSKIKKQKSEPIKKSPIFILGHWRSGTTFLHNLLIQDEQFIYPKIFEVIHPSTFQYLQENYIEKIKKHEVKSRPMDNVKNDPMSAGEEEFAMAALTLRSPIVGWVFPKRYEHYERYLCLKDITEAELENWKKEYLAYLKKINSDPNKTLILKSPTNTARIKILLDIFPNAKFINIHRNPYHVYSSTKRLHDTAIKSSSLQKGVKYDTHKRIINTYKKLYDNYFNELPLISKERFVDISFEELEKSPIETVKMIYSSLNIPDFKKMEPKLIEYLNSIGQYKKNNYSEIDDELKNKIYTVWEKYFKYWNYN